MIGVFFFSSRRRHTRSKRDWSSDVCSSDLAQGRPIACMAWSSAPRHLGSRDRYIGWSAEARRQNIRFIAYNTRFLILPWARVPHLASHILGRVTGALSDDWELLYGHPVYFA